MSKAFEIPSTPCKLVDVNPRIEYHGDDEVPCVDLKFEGVVFTKDMLISFTGDKHCWDLMFEQKKGAAVEPTQAYFEKRRYFDAKFEDCSATIRFGMQTGENEFEDVKVKGIYFDPLVGGNCASGFTVQYELDDTSIMAELTEYMNREVHLGVIFGKKADADAKAKKKQQNLPLTEKTDESKAAGGKGEDEARPAATH